ncbi:hypothetical protein DFH09DRAFT_1291442 [Mycena vulgaris]|nr:hypothetical protein DFH09DRAFT_1291442 [Mycena vulgaris]
MPSKPFSAKDSDFEWYGLLEAVFSKNHQRSAEPLELLRTVEDLSNTHWSIKGIHNTVARRIDAGETAGHGRRIVNAVGVTLPAVDATNCRGREAETEEARRCRPWVPLGAYSTGVTEKATLPTLTGSWTQLQTERAGGCAMETVMTNADDADDAKGHLVPAGDCKLTTASSGGTWKDVTSSRRQQSTQDIYARARRLHSSRGSAVDYNGASQECRADVSTRAECSVDTLLAMIVDEIRVHSKIKRKIQLLQLGGTVRKISRQGSERRTHLAGSEKDLSLVLPAGCAPVWHGGPGWPKRLLAVRFQKYSG